MFAGDPLRLDNLSGDYCFSLDLDGVFNGHRLPWVVEFLGGYKFAKMDSPLFLAFNLKVLIGTYGGKFRGSLQLFRHT